MAVAPDDLRCLLLHQCGVDFGWWCLKAVQVASGGGTPRELQEMAEYLTKRVVLRGVEMLLLQAAEGRGSAVLYDLVLHAMSQQWLEGFYFNRLWSTRAMAFLLSYPLGALKEAFIPDDHAALAIMYLASFIPPTAPDARFFVLEAAHTEASPAAALRSANPAAAVAGLFTADEGHGEDDAAAGTLDTSFAPGVLDAAEAVLGGEYDLMDPDSVGPVLDATRVAWSSDALSTGMRAVASGTLQRHLLAAVVDVFHTAFLAPVVASAVSRLHGSVPKWVSSYIGSGRFTGVPARPPSERRRMRQVKAATLDLIGNAFVRAAGAGGGYAAGYAAARSAYALFGWEGACPRRWAHYAAYWGGCGGYLAWTYALTNMEVLTKTVRVEPWDGWFRVRVEDVMDPLSDDEENDHEDYERINAVHKNDEESLYAKLGVERDVTPGELKKAYHKLSRLHHPDRHPPKSEGARDAEEKMKDVTQAYYNLSDERRRRIYDAHLDARERDPPPPSPTPDTTEAAPSAAAAAAAASPNPPAAPETPTPTQGQYATAFVAFHSTRTVAIALTYFFASVSLFRGVARGETLGKGLDSHAV
eukprot:TRINITY_DN3489_c1_g1_i1.p1 TRINITY_DN3489_c1_g1~~TRINITY_DN3489_c1_g1_i1.p1  ORF type:complete len:620 (+),score=192.30 TRINITY_DN3489_c1_g1_i1:104-1861(+)